MWYTDVMKDARFDIDTTRESLIEKFKLISEKRLFVNCSTNCFLKNLSYNGNVSMMYLLRTFNTSPQV